jgi:hypothetical protein
LLLLAAACCCLLLLAAACCCLLLLAAARAFGKKWKLKRKRTKALENLKTRTSTIWVFHDVFISIESEWRKQSQYALLGNRFDFGKWLGDIFGLDSGLIRAEIRNQENAEIRYYIYKCVCCRCALRAAARRWRVDRGSKGSARRHWLVAEGSIRFGNWIGKCAFRQLNQACLENRIGLESGIEPGSIHESTRQSIKESEIELESTPESSPIWFPRKP